MIAAARCAPLFFPEQIERIKSAVLLRFWKTFKALLGLNLEIICITLAFFICTIPVRAKASVINLHIVSSTVKAHTEGEAELGLTSRRIWETVPILDRTNKIIVFKLFHIQPCTPVKHKKTGFAIVYAATNSNCGSIACEYSNASAILYNRIWIMWRIHIE